jgi:CP family cyanate transporter-like MFS transporter
VALVVVGSLSIPVSLLLPGLAASRPAQYRLVAVTTVAYATGYIGLLCAPGMLVWLWAALLGIGNGAFPLSVTMIGLRSRQPRVTTALSGLVQGGGYLLAITGPMLVSALHQSSGGWRVPLLALLGTLVLQLVSGMRAAMPRTVESELGIAACHIAPRS